MPLSPMALFPRCKATITQLLRAGACSWGPKQESTKTDRDPSIAVLHFILSEHR